MGLHRRKPDEQRWYQTAWSFTPHDGIIGGCGGIGVDPNDGAVLYTLFGSGSGRSVMGLFKSTDYGTTWTHLLEVYENTNQGDEFSAVYHSRPKPTD